MGFMDDMNDALNSGLGAAERQGKLLKIQGDIKRLELKLDRRYAELGREVFADQELRSYLERSHLEAYTKVNDLLGEMGGLKARLEELKRSPAPAAKTAQHKQYACPSCGHSVALTDSYCTSCGDNLEGLKANRRMCPSCESLYLQSVSFCPDCGARTVELVIAPKIDTSEADIPNPVVYTDANEDAGHPDSASHEPEVLDEPVAARSEAVPDAEEASEPVGQDGLIGEEAAGVEGDEPGEDAVL